MSIHYDDELWALAEREYLSGETAAVICGRYGVSLSSFRAHARAGGWRRMDRPDCDLTPEPGEYHADDDVSFADLADQAFLNIRRALGARRAAEAASWMRLYERLNARARETANPPPDAPGETLRLASVETTNPSESKVMSSSTDIGSRKMDSLDSVFSESRPAVLTAPKPAEPPLDAGGLEQRLLRRTALLGRRMAVSDAAILAAIGQSPPGD